MDDKRALQEEVAKLRRELEMRRTAREHRQPAAEDERWAQVVDRSSNPNQKQRQRPISAHLLRSAGNAENISRSSLPSKQLERQPLREEQPTQHNYSRLEQLYNRVCKANNAGPNT